MHNYGAVKKHKGMTLVEVMIAITLGLLITAAITTMFVSMRKSYKQNDSIARMQENARFAMEMITQDLRHAGFFGNEADPMFIDTTRALSVASSSDDCGGTAGGVNGIYNFASPVLLLNYGNNLTSDPGSISVSVKGVNVSIFSECVTDTELNPDGSSILLVKRSSTTDTDAGSIASGVVYTRANGSQSQLYHSGNPSTLVNGTNLEYQPHVYYIDTDNTLQRKFLQYSSSAPELVSEPLAEGIDAFHIEFGIDTDHNGTPEYYYTPTADSISNVTIDDAVSATVYILARTTEADRDHLDNKTYSLGSMNLGPYNDNFHRRVYSASTSLKNIRYQVMLR